MSDIQAIRKEAAHDPRKLLELALKQAETNPEEMRRDIRLLDPTCVDTIKAITFKLGPHEFKPLVAYPIYAADYIRGYREPKIVIEYDPLTLIAHVEFTFAERVSDEAPDALELLKNFMPEGTVYNNRDQWTKQCASEKPKVLELLGSASNVFSSRSDLKVSLLKFGGDASAYLHRVFAFSWFYIEGAQPPDETDKTWDVFVVTDGETSEFRGYSSVYSFLYYSSAAEFESEGATTKLLRKRIGHFLVLPAFQKSGVGKTLYLSLLKTFVSEPQTKEIEVEEPSAEFDVLRDRSHYEWLTSDNDTRDLLDDYVDNPEEALAKLMKQYKMEAVQFQRVAEMFYFMQHNQKETRDLKKMIKSRLYAHNYEDLRTMDNPTQRDQLQAVYENALHQHKVALHLEEDDEDEDEDDSGDEGGELDPAEALLGQLLQGGSSSVLDLLQEPNKRQKTE